MKANELIVYLQTHDAAAAIRFYTEAFGAEERYRLTAPTGKIGHAELAFGQFDVYLADEFPEMGLFAPSAEDPARVTLHLHVDDADAWVERAVAAGATLSQPVQDQFYGERSGSVMDPFGYRWLIGHHVEDVTPEEMQRRYSAFFE